MSLHPNEVLLAPVVSEKSYSLITDGKYTFKVHQDAHKTQIRQAVEQLFDVKVERVNIVKVQSKPKRRGLKRRYRVIDFKRVKDGVPAKVAAIEYDPNRSARIALLHYADGAKAYILAPARLRVGAMVESGPNADIRPGNALPLANIPTGTPVHNVELKPGRGGQLARSAGSGVQLVAKDEGYAVLRLPSGELRRV